MAIAGGMKSHFTGIDAPSENILANCIHCGLCLPTCPTYAITWLERSSPRGRIRLIKSVSDKKIPISKEFVDEMNFCLDCKACETACPAGIKFGSLIEAARTQIYEGGAENSLFSYIKHFLLQLLFENHKRLKFAATLLKIVQKKVLNKLVNGNKPIEKLYKQLKIIQSLTPKVSDAFTSNTLNERLYPFEQERYKIIFITGCIMDVCFSHVNEDTVKLLQYHNCEVITPKNQKCCGSLQAHNSDLRGARKLAMHNINTFLQYDFDYIVLNSAGCGAFMKHYGDLFNNDPTYAKKGEYIASRVKDITEFLYETGYKPSLKIHPFYNKKITYHDACHLVHSQRISNQPRKLIESIPGITFIELRESSWCCGSAGIYNLTHYVDSMKILARKIENIKLIDPDIVVTGNPGCMIQIQHGLNQSGHSVELIHTATFLWRACGQ